MHSEAEQKTPTTDIPTTDSESSGDGDVGTEMTEEELEKTGI